MKWAAGSASAAARPAWTACVKSVACSTTSTPDSRSIDFFHGFASCDMWTVTEKPRIALMSPIDSPRFPVDPTTMRRWAIRARTSSRRNAVGPSLRSMPTSRAVPSATSRTSWMPPRDLTEPLTASASSRLTQRSAGNGCPNSSASAEASADSFVNADSMMPPVGRVSGKSSSKRGANQRKRSSAASMWAGVRAAAGGSDDSVRPGNPLAV